MSGTVFERDQPRRRRPAGELLLLGLVPPVLVLLYLGRAVLGTRPGRAAAVLLAVGVPLAVVAGSAQPVDAPGAAPPSGWWSGLGRQRARLPFGGLFGSRPAPAAGAAVAPAAAASTAGAAPRSGVGGALVPLESRLVVELLNGRTARLAGSGLWADPSIPMSRVRLERGALTPPAARLTPAEAAEEVRQLLAEDYRTVDLMGTTAAIAWRLGPEEAGTSAAAGVTAPSDPVLGQSLVWVVTARCEGRPTHEALQVAGPLPPMLEVLLVDARTGDVLLRPPPMGFADADALLRRDGPSPAGDPTRPLGFFGDPAP